MYTHILSIKENGFKCIWIFMLIFSIFRFWCQCNFNNWWYWWSLPEVFRGSRRHGRSPMQKSWPQEVHITTYLYCFFSLPLMRFFGLKKTVWKKRRSILVVNFKNLECESSKSTFSKFGHEKTALDRMPVLLRDWRFFCLQLDQIVANTNRNF